MDGQMYRCTDGWMDGLDSELDEMHWNGWMDVKWLGCKDEMDNEWMEERYGWMDRWID